MNKTDTCWLWTSHLRGKGYGFINIFDSRIGAHRFSWELYNHRKVPAGMCVCHSCDVMHCVNPEHLFIGTCADNNRDRDVKGRNGQAVKTHCKAGHPLSGDNLRIMTGQSAGQRGCRTCIRRYARADKARRLAARTTPPRRPKLDAQAVLTIRAEYTGAYGELRRIAASYGVRAPTIANVVNGRTWTEVKGEM